jgi:hypothetical protein
MCDPRYAQQSSAVCGTYLTALLVAVSISCGAPESPPPEAPPAEAASAASGSLDPCGLLTKAEIESQVSWTVVKSTPYPNGDRGHCQHEGAGGMGGLEQADVGVLECFTNFPCRSDMPKVFASSAALVDYRKKLYEGSGSPVEAGITPVEGLGVPALMHEMAGYYTIEMWLGDHRIAFVSTWESEAATRSLGEKLLARSR